MLSHANFIKYACISGRPTRNPKRTRRLKNVHRKNPFTTIRIVSSGFVHNYIYKLMHSANEYRKNIQGQSPLESRENRRESHSAIPCYCFNFVLIRIQPHHTNMHHASSKTRLFGDKNQQRYMSTSIVLRQNETIVSCARKQIAQMTLQK